MFGSCALAALNSSCEHQPFDLPVSSADSCDVNAVKYYAQIQPILDGNCGMQGCHNASTKAEGVNLTSYETTIATGGVKAGIASESELYKSLARSDDERMPQGLPALSESDIDLIKTWINQGALDLSCADNDTTTIPAPSFSAEVQPIFQANCELPYCHAAGGQSPTLSTYDQISAQGARVKARTTAKTMPPSGSTALTQEEIDIIANWVNGGTPNN